MMTRTSKIRAALIATLSAAALTAAAVTPAQAATGTVTYRARPDYRTVTETNPAKGCHVNGGQAFVNNTNAFINIYTGNASCQHGVGKSYTVAPHNSFGGDFLSFEPTS
ncbi:hypothetical protein ABTX81_01335 [Kitasatospora sp. NPDC097605]|uniref:hypothetical protein n=1 Tax=Kitasatospora sp. NPDC097605 TaxID=3157226 RepID=UPI003321BEF3